MRRLPYPTLWRSLPFLLLSPVICQAQQTEGIPEFVKLMRQRGNFNQVRQSFEAYNSDQQAQGRLQQQSTATPKGFKQYKRWEYWWQPRTFPGGQFPPTGIELQEFRDFRRKARQSATGEQGNWKALGPTNWTNVTGHWNPGIGRINTIVVAPRDPNTIFLGTPAGGLWKTSDGGRKWTCLTDNIPTLGVSAIAVNPHNMREILIGTGDRDASHTYGVGILKTTDGGQTWQPTSLRWSLESGHTSARMVMHPYRHNIVYAATTDGLFKTTNFGNTWQRILYGDVDDLEMKPDDPNTIYAVANQSLYKSTDAGNSFVFTGQYSPYRVQIAVSPAAPSNVYFFSMWGLYISRNAGNTFDFMSNSPTEGVQDWYDLAIAVSPRNAREIHVGEIETYRSLDGGATWERTAEWVWPNTTGYVHADIHDMVFSGNTLYVASDGLITKSTDGGHSWTDLSASLSIQQFYNIGLSTTDPNKFGGGTQDNGTNIHTRNLGGWHGWLGADGFETIIAPDNQTIYGSIYFGRYYKSTDGGSNSVYVTQPGYGGWNSPLVMHPTDANTLYCGLFGGVFKTSDGMLSWNNIGSFEFVDKLSIGQCNPNYLYASGNGIIWVTKDGGTTWRDITAGLPGLYITQIAIDPSNPERVAVTLSNYSRGEKVYISRNAGKTWTNISYNLPNLPANAGVFQRSQGLYVGMDVGVYFLPNGSKTWQAYYKGLANAPITELEIQEKSRKLRAGTFGRGMWETPLCGAPIERHKAGLTEKADEGEPAPATEITAGIYPNPVSTVLNVSFNSADNSRTLLRIVDLNGKVWIEKKVDAVKGANLVQLPVQQLKTGVYMLHIENAAIKEARKFYVQ